MVDNKSESPLKAQKKRKANSKTASGTSQSSTTESDQYLVAKIGHEAEFLAAVREANQIHTGKLGFRGNAQMMLEMGLFDSIGIKFKGKTDEEKLDEAEQTLRQIFGQRLMEHGEWVTGTIAENREVLFSDITPSNTEG